MRFVSVFNAIIFLIRNAVRFVPTPKRNKEVVCVVEDIRDVMAIENTGQFQGVYHVLGGKISPMEGVGPQDLTI